MVQARFHALVVATCAALVLLTNLGGPALWDDDEPKNAACSLAMLDANDWVVPTFNGRLRIEKPPLANWLQIAGYTVCGRNETGARIGSALLTIGTCLLTWRMGCLLLSPSAGLLGGLVMATCIWTAVGGRAATPDAPLLFCTALAFFLFAREVSAARATAGATAGPIRLSTQAACGIGAACGAAVLAKGPVGVVLPLAAFTLFACWNTSGQSGSSWRVNVAGLRLPVIVATTAAVAVPWYAWVSWRTDGEWLRGFLLVHNFGRFAAPMEGHSGSLLYYPMVIAIGLFPWSIVLLAMLAHAVGILRSPQDDDRKMPLRLLAAWSLAWIGGFSCAGTKLPGYVWPAYPALAMLTGLFLDDWVRGRADCVRWCRDPDRALGLVMRVAWSWLAALGVALVVALPLAAAFHAPGNEWLGLIGLVPLSAAVWAWRCQTAGQAPRALATLAVCACLTITLMAALAADRFSRSTGMRSFAAVLEHPDGSCTWACFWNVPPSLVFYLSVDQTLPDFSSGGESLQAASPRVTKLDTAEDVARHLSSHPRARLMIDSRHLKLVTAAIPAHCGVLARIPTLADHHYVVIGADLSPAPPLALND